MGSPVDDELDRLGDTFDAVSPYAPDPFEARVERRREFWEALATVRSELQRLREERDATMRSYDSSLRTLAKAVGAAEAAEAEVRRLTEGLREAETGFNDISLILEAENDGYQERAYKRAMEEWRHVRALLSASPSDGGGAK